MRYGNLPTDLGLVDINPTEMMFHMYMPISIPGSDQICVPEHMEMFMPIITNVKQHDYERFKNEYVYLTAKTLWVNDKFIGNRPGWHSDGFGSNDINYVWTDRAPTDFLHIVRHPSGWMNCNDYTFHFDDNQPNACERFYEACSLVEGQVGDTAAIKHYPDKHLLKLDPSVIHRSPVNFEAGMRSFVKVSISPDAYNLKGNATNYLLPMDWKYATRQVERNHPTAKEID